MKYLSFPKLILLISLFSFQIKTETPKPKLLTLTEDKYDSLLKNYKFSLVLMYEDWCKHSKKALNEIKELTKMEKFLDLEIPIGFFNLYKLDNFKAYKSIKHVPIINLHIDNNEITYHGILKKDLILTWIIEKTKLSKIEEIKELEDLEKILATNRYVFMYYGDNLNLRFNIFSEGYYHYPSQKFIWTNNPYIKQEYNLTKNCFYLFEKGKDIKKYKKAFKKLRYLQWVSMHLQIKVRQIFSNTLENQKKTKTPTLVFLYEKATNKNELELFKNNYEIFFENASGKSCEKNDFDCKSFLKVLPTSFTTYPQIFIMAFNDSIDVPLFYLMKKEFNLENFRNFFDDYRGGKIEFDVFSEECKEVYDSQENDRAYKISRNSFKDFFVENYGMDKIILFYSSNCKNCLKIKKVFENLSEKILKNDFNKKHISLAHMDMDKNSHEIFYTSDKNVFLRFYKLNEFKRYHDIKIDFKNIDKFSLKLKNFISDSSTQRIEDEEIIDEM